MSLLSHDQLPAFSEALFRYFWSIFLADFILKLLQDGLEFAGFQENPVLLDASVHGHPSITIRHLGHVFLTDRARSIAQAVRHGVDVLPQVEIQPIGVRQDEIFHLGEFFAIEPGPGAVRTHVHVDGIIEFGHHTRAAVWADHTLLLIFALAIILIDFSACRVIRLGRDLIQAARFEQRLLLTRPLL